MIKIDSKDVHFYVSKDIIGINKKGKFIQLPDYYMIIIETETNVPTNQFYFQVRVDEIILDVCYRMKYGNKHILHSVYTFKEV